MAKVDIRGLKKVLNGFVKEVQSRKAQKQVQALVETEVIGSIKKGKSPVKGYGRFPKYSKSYTDQIRNKVGFYTDSNGNLRAIPKGRNRATNRFVASLNERLTGKKRSPVNLKVTGEMLDSFFVKVRRRAQSLLFDVGFKDEKAEWHNEGQGRLPTRRIIPDRTNEEFSRVITNRITRLYKSIVSRVAKRKR